MERLAAALSRRRRGEELGDDGPHQRAEAGAFPEDQPSRQQERLAAASDRQGAAGAGAGRTTALRRRVDARGGLFRRARQDTLTLVASRAHLDDTRSLDRGRLVRRDVPSGRSRHNRARDRRLFARWSIHKVSRSKQETMRCHSEQRQPFTFNHIWAFAAASRSGAP